jgi:hypothetical protein
MSLLKLALFRFVRSFQALLQRVRLAAGAAPVINVGDVGEAAEHLGEPALPAEILDSPGIERLKVRGSVKLAERSRFKGSN